MEPAPESRRTRIERLRKLLAEGERSGVAPDFSWERLNADLDAEANSLAPSRRPRSARRPRPPEAPR